MEPCTKEAELAGLKSDVKTIFKRIDEQLAFSKLLYELVAEVKVMNTEMRSLREGQDDLKKEVEDLKAQPRRRWEDVVKTAVTAIVGGLIAYVFFKLGLK